MAFSKNVSTYDDVLSRLRKLAPRSFLDYFYKNWHECRAMSAGYETFCVENLGNTTNNKIESHNQKIKMVLHRNMTITQAVQGLMSIHRSAVVAMSHSQFLKVTTVAYRVGTKSATIDVILQALTPYAAGIVVAELDEAQKAQVSYANADCQCPFKNTMRLPCRHLLAKRIQHNEAELFSIIDAHDRWQLSYTTNKNSLIYRDTLKIVERDNKKKLGPLSKAEKYNTVLNMCKTGADICSSVGMRQFNERIDTLQILFNSWVSGKKLIITEVTENSHYDDNDEVSAVGEDKCEREMNIIYDDIANENNCDVSGSDMIINNEMVNVTEQKRKL